MDSLQERLLLAKENSDELNLLVKDYIPFIKKEASKANTLALDYDDRFSIAALVFVSCVKQYDGTKGAFLPFAAVCIKNRLIDEGKKAANYQKRIIPLFEDIHGELRDNADQASYDQYSAQEERSLLTYELQSLSKELEAYGLSFLELAHIAPKQKRSRSLCAALANQVTADQKMRSHFFKTKRLPQQELSRLFNISEKTLEKHRKYIVALVLILSGEYPAIRSFLPEQEVR